MSDKIIRLRDAFNSSSLVTRQAARDLFDMIQHSPETRIALDFDGIEYSSRSFFDELLSKEPLFMPLGKNVTFVNVSRDLEQTMDLVKNPSHHELAYQSVSNAEALTI